MGHFMRAEGVRFDDARNFSVLASARASLRHGWRF
jgi:hypothetical protein